ncbi:MAG: alpha/beta fold hydrolase [Anaerolineae bacterium]
MLHGGFIQNRQVWHQTGYVSRLSADFTVITIDLRGHGESAAPLTPQAYAADRICADVQAVVAACGFDTFDVWGFSLGATIALQMAARTTALGRAVVAGSHFGTIFTPENVAASVAWTQHVLEAKKSGQLEALGLSSDQRGFLEQANLDVTLAWYQALAYWPIVNPSDIRCPVLLYAGSLNAVTAARVREFQPQYRAAAVEYHIFEGLTHLEELSSIDTVFPLVKSFLTA